MAIQSSGVVVKTPNTIWTGTPATWDSMPLGNRWVSYSAMYEANETVAAVVDKIARATARLPLKVYERTANGRPEASDHPLARLLRNPNPMVDAFTFWIWTVSTLNIYGEAFWGKIRDRGGRPAELMPMHPSCMKREADDRGNIKWSYDTGRVRLENISRSDLVHFRFFNPNDLNRGLSPLEALRHTLSNDDAARRATESFWARGARPGVALSHPGQLSPGAADRLRFQWDSLNAGADNTGKTVVLEEGMKPEILTISNDEAQYIESRKLSRESILIRYDFPPPALHILDHATFSNITEQNRSVYRDTMAPRLKHLESTVDFELRAPDFGDEVYAEFLMDEVLRGDFEKRVESYRILRELGWPLNELREMENKPALPGGDRPMVNSTYVPLLDQEEFSTADRSRVDAAGILIRAGFDAAGALAAVGLPDIPHTGLLPVTVQSEDQLEVLPPATVRSVMGRLGRVTSLDDIDRTVLVRGLNGEAATVLAHLDAAVAAGDGVDGFKTRLRGETKEPEAKTPEVHVTVHQAPITVNTPDVNVETRQPDVNVTVEAAPARKKIVERDERGHIVAVTEE